MNFGNMMLGAFGLVSLVTIYYLFLRKPAAKPSESNQQ
jgi:hypothetical protein